MDEQRPCHFRRKSSCARECRPTHPGSSTSGTRTNGHADRTVPVHEVLGTDRTCRGSAGCECSAARDVPTPLGTRQTTKDKGRRLPSPFPFQRIAHRGPCGKTRVVPQNLRPKPGPAEIRDSRSTGALVDVWVSRYHEPGGTCVRMRAPSDCAEQLA